MVRIFKFRLFVFSLIFLIFFTFVSVNAIAYTSCNSSVSSGSHTLNNDIITNVSCFIFSGNNVYFDCQGYSIVDNGSAAYGFDTNSRSNVTIKNCNIGGFSNQIHADSMYSNFLNLNLTSGSSIYFVSTTDSIIDNVRIINSFRALDLRWAKNVNISNVYIENATNSGIYM
ncbi:MAG: hypothetical protein KC550_04835 [Nanoarchaeota archaeon]|nr:hypothetical protein [Nanoarchaeota archaeon]